MTEANEIVECDAALEMLTRTLCPEAEVVSDRRKDYTTQVIQLEPGGEKACRVCLRVDEDCRRVLQESVLGVGEARTV